MGKDFEVVAPVPAPFHQGRLVLIRMPKSLPVSSLNGLRVKYRSSGGGNCEFRMDDQPSYERYSIGKASVQQSPVCMAIPGDDEGWRVVQPFSEVWEVRREVEVPTAVKRVVRPDTIQRDAYAETCKPIEQPPLPTVSKSFWQVPDNRKRKRTQ